MLEVGWAEGDGRELPEGPGHQFHAKARSREVKTLVYFGSEIQRKQSLL
jgi:hypothetical protein